MDNQKYREFLINHILEWQKPGQFSREDLEKKSIRELEIIFDNV